MVKVAVIYYSTYGHVAALAEAEADGLRQAGVEVDILQFPETLSQDILKLMYAPGQDTNKHALVGMEDLVQYDGFLFGIPTRYGTFPAQFKTFWDATINHWKTGALHGKYFGMFVSTASAGGGQETTARNTITSFIHHGMIYVPLGYKNAFTQLTNLDEVHGGSPWGAGTLAASDGSRFPSELEKEVATIQGKSFGDTLKRAFPDTEPTDEGSVPEKASASTSNTPSTTTTTTTSSSPQTASLPSAKQPVQVVEKPSTKAPSRGPTQAQTSTDLNEKKSSSKCCVIA